MYFFSWGRHPRLLVWYIVPEVDNYSAHKVQARTSKYIRFIIIVCVKIVSCVKRLISHFWQECNIIMVLIFYKQQKHCYLENTTWKDLNFLRTVKSNHMSTFNEITGSKLGTAFLNISSKFYRLWIKKTHFLLYVSKCQVQLSHIHEDNDTKLVILQIKIGKKKHLANLT